MSSTPDDRLDPQKKRRLQNACDTCRKRKVKCNSAEMPDNICTGCLATNMECTHSMPLRKRGPKPGTAGPLERRVIQLEEMLRRTSNPTNSEANRGSSGESASPPSNHDAGVTASSESSSSASRLSSQSPIAGSATAIPAVEDETGLADSVANMNIGRMMQNGRFFGPSSFHYLQDAVQVKTEYIKSENPLSSEPPASQRRHFWSDSTHELLTAMRSIPTYEFPPEDLMYSLFDIFFREIRHEIPIVHEPTFRRDVTSGLHLSNHYFGGTVLLVCAVASRISKDPRVFIPGAPEYSCGWHWYEQVQMIRKVMYEPPTLHELQSYCLATVYALGTSSPGMIPYLTSLGLRVCQELGVHRKRPSNYKSSIADELKRRCFWTLVTFDRWTSSFVGRPTGYREEDYDVELPIECDDEFMTEDGFGVASFQQPGHIPSNMAYLNHHVKLLDILSLALRSLYSTEKSRIQMGLAGENWEIDAVTKLDSALNEWESNLPDTLKYDPQEPDFIRFSCASNLLICYRVVQIQIHRPLMARSGPILRSSSSIICVGAARSCASILHLQMQRNLPPVSASLISCFMCAVTLLMHIWGNKQGGIVTNIQRDVADVEKCMAYLEYAEGRWHNARAFREMLKDLSLVKDIPLPDAQRIARKRDRDDTQLTEETVSSFSGVDFPRNPDDPVLSGHKWNLPESISAAAEVEGNLANDWRSIPQPLDALSYDGYTNNFASDLGAVPQESQSFSEAYSSLPGEDINNMFWQAPINFDMREWQSYIAKTTDELQRHPTFGM